LSRSLPSARPGRIVLAAASDEGYALPLTVMLSSAAGQLAADFHIDAHVLADELSDATCNRVEASLPTAVTIHWQRSSAAEFADLPRWGRMSLATYHKLQLGSWLPPQVDKVIWLDCDTLVLGDLSELWGMSLDGRTALACRDPLVPRLGSSFGVAAWRELNLPAGDPYFNAGVMLIDIDRWRKYAVEQRSLAYLRRFHDRVWFWDQEALNASLAGDWGRLQPSWNWSPLEFAQASWAPGSEPTPQIVHFIGNIKPWRVAGNGPFFGAYQQWLDRTAWRGTRVPQTLTGRILAAYTGSRARVLLRPLERLYMRWIRWSTRRSIAMPKRST
jgi:lipopolysaccharide biosynthesis glycosyltransferase